MVNKARNTYTVQHRKPVIQDLNRMVAQLID
jgi:hypothetical protein